MMRKIGTLLFGLMSTSALAQPILTPPTFIPPPASGGTPFTLPTGDVLHYIAPNGNDSCNGTSPTIGSSGNCAWLTPNHALNCGDVIIAAAGSHNQDFSHWGTVSNCPSTTGGIDGTGGIYAAVLLCGASDLGTNGCIVNCATAVCNGTPPGGTSGRSNPGSAFNLFGSNWAIIGWQAYGNGTLTTDGRLGFVSDACFTQTTLIHHTIYINNVAVNAGAGFATDECGLNHNVPGNGVDYWGVIGNISQNAGQNPVCDGSNVHSGPANSDTNSGIHSIQYGNFISTTRSAGCTNSDMEAMMLDTPDAHAYAGTVAWFNNMTWNNVRYGIQAFYQHCNTNTLPLVLNFHHNTHYADLIGVLSTKDFAPGQINLASGAPSGCTAGLPTWWTLNIQNNISVTDAATVNTVVIYAATFGGTTWGTLNNGGTGNENIFKGMATTCNGTCNPAGPNTTGDDITEFNGNPLGTNIYKNPAFRNASDLLTNWLGAPNCTGFVTTTACYGYNVATQTLTPNTPIYDLQPTATQTSGKGYQLPSATCNTNSDYAPWLKGLVRLQWNPGSSTITQMHDLVTTACGL